jgi:hypothetical protein
MILEKDPNQNSDIILIKTNISIEPKLTDYDLFFLLNYNLTPHFQRDIFKLAEKFEHKQGYSGYYGKEGEYFIRSIIFLTEEKKIKKIGVNQISFDELDCVININKPAHDCPSLHCPWKPNTDGDVLLHDGVVKERNYKWLNWLINGFFKPNKYTLNGEIIISDSVLNNERHIIIKNNEIKIKKIKGEIIEPTKTTIPSRELKTSDNILNDLIYKTENDLIHWTKDRKYNNYKYVYIITKKKNATFTLIKRNDNRNKSYINISFNIPNRSWFVRALRGYKISKLIDVIEEKSIQY